MLVKSEVGAAATWGIEDAMCVQPVSMPIDDGGEGRTCKNLLLVVQVPIWCALAAVARNRIICGQEVYTRCM